MEKWSKEQKVKASTRELTLPRHLLVEAGPGVLLDERDAVKVLLERLLDNVREPHGRWRGVVVGVVAPVAGSMMMKNSEQLLPQQAVPKCLVSLFFYFFFCLLLFVGFYFWFLFILFLSVSLSVSQSLIGLLYLRALQIKGPFHKPVDDGVKDLGAFGRELHVVLVN